jgi:peptide/nickel transport system ATP-binding protein
VAQQSLLRVDDLQIAFSTQRGTLQALCGVSFDVQQGEIFGLVGETGCGKSITGLAILRLVPRPGRITSGEITFQGENLLAKSENDLRQLRGATIATIFQDPSTALNPVFTIGAQLTEVLRQHRSMSKAEARAEALKTMADVGLPDAERLFNAYPHELSGGMQQRAMVAMALVCEPALIIADEPTTALDVTIQAQILRLLRDLRDRLGIAILLITHDLAVIAQMCDRVAVLYAGRVVEMGTTHDLLNAPQHPYTQGLIAAVPRPGQRGQRLVAIPGTVPSNPGAVTGCAFAPRCSHAFDRCHADQPEGYEVGDGHTAACFLAEAGHE